jgi:hypothetical protein
MLIPVAAKSHVQIKIGCFQSTLDDDRDDMLHTTGTDRHSTHDPDSKKQDEVVTATWSRSTTQGDGWTDRAGRVAKPFNLQRRAAGSRFGASKTFGQRWASAGVLR